MVLVIWPEWQKFKILYSGEDGFKRAQKEVEAASKNAQPSEKDMKIALQLLRICETDRQLAARTLCDAALAWEDSSLWCKAAEACSKDQGVRVVPSEHLLVAIAALGWNALESS